MSADADKISFEACQGDMPWLALPYARRDLKEGLSKHFKVTEIPTLIVVSAQTGAVQTRQGRQHVIADPEGSQFPWKPRPFWECLESAPAIDHDGQPVPFASMRESEAIGIFFSAGWSPPCRGSVWILLW